MVLVVPPMPWLMKACPLQGRAGAPVHSVGGGLGKHWTQQLCCALERSWPEQQPSWDCSQRRSRRWSAAYTYAARPLHMHGTCAGTWH